MQEFMRDAVKDMQNFLKWLSKDYPLWENTWDGTYSSANTLEQIDIIEQLQENGRYPQILNLVLDFHNEMGNYAIQSIIEVISETWDKEQWDEVIKKIIDKIKIK